VTSLACNMNLPPEFRLGQLVLTASHDNQAQTLVPLIEALGEGDPESTEGRPRGDALQSLVRILKGTEYSGRRRAGLVPG
jgi:hypothetical protein